MKKLLLLLIFSGFIFCGNADAVPFSGDAWLAQHITSGGPTNEYFLVIDSLGINKAQLKGFRFKPDAIERDFSLLTGSDGNTGITWFEIDKNRSKVFRKESKRFSKGLRKGKIDPGTNIDEWISNRLSDRKYKLKINKKFKTKIGFATFKNDENPGNGGGSPVPEPATMLLLGSGLVGMAAAGRKKFFKK